MSSRTTFRNDIKIIVIGNSGVGKTSFVNKWTKNIFSNSSKATIGSEYGYKVFEHNCTIYNIQLWDIAGQDKNIMVTKYFARDSHGCIIMSDATNVEMRNE
jgi:small GTP-binding protein